MNQSQIKPSSTPSESPWAHPELRAAMVEVLEEAIEDARANRRMDMVNTFQFCLDHIDAIAAEANNQRLQSEKVTV